MRAGVRLFLLGDHAEQRGLAGAVRADDADNAAGRQLEGEVVDQEIVAIAFLQRFEIDDILAEPLGDRDDDLRGLRLLLAGLLHQILIALIARLRLGLPRLGRCRDPFLLGGERALARFLLAAFLLQALLLLPEPGGVIALVGNAAAAIELENPAGHVVEKIAVMGDDQNGAGIIAQMPLEPGDGLGVEMVGRLVEQEQVGLIEQQLAERDAAALAAGELRHIGIVGRAAQRIHRQIDLGIEIPQPLGLDLVLQLGHLVRGLVGIIHRELVVAVEDRFFRRHAFDDVLAHRLVLVERGLLRQEADARAFAPPRPRR